MKILVLGGTRFFGKHMVSALVKGGHDVTVATRGLAPDNFGDSVARISLDRNDPDSLKLALAGKSFDIVCDNICYCSQDVKLLITAYSPPHYVMTSTTAVYEPLVENTTEDLFLPERHSYKLCTRKDDTYGECKRQAEAALRQKYPDIPAAAVRFPYVIGDDDYTERLYFYIEHTINGKPMYVDNLEKKMSFVRSDEAGAFLAYCAEHKLTGAYNGASSGSISVGEIISYTESKTGKKALLQGGGDQAPYNGTPQYTINTDRALAAGFSFTPLSEWIYELVDRMIEKSREGTL